MLVLIDNYDSFTYNLVHFLGELGAPCEVFRNDKISVAGVLKLKPKGIVLSPGPCTPNEAGICLELIAKAGPTVPLLGVCLGHQAHRPGLRRRGHARARAHARQAVQDHQHRQGPVQGPAQELRGDALSLADRRAQRPAQRPDRHRQDQRRPDHGPAAQDASRARRAVPSREHRLRARPRAARQLPRAGRHQPAAPNARPARHAA